MIKIFFLYLPIVTIATSMSLSAKASQKRNLCSAPKQLNSKWAGAEHVYLADRGFREACSASSNKYCKASHIFRQDQNKKYTYGEISVLGDFYLDPRGPWVEQGERQMTSDGSDQIFKCIDKQGRVFEEQKLRPEVSFPDCTWTYFFNAGNFLYVVSNNTNHFAWHNMIAYTSIHKEALESALSSYKSKVSGDLAESDEAMRRALYINAFADHFLADSFPAGHLRVPRKQIKDWAKTDLSGFFKMVRGEALSIVLHDNEGNNSNDIEVGLAVKNSRGDYWNTHADGKLHECTQDDDPGIRIPTEAISRSVAELLLAQSQGVLPEGVYSATELVPFPASSTLTERYEQQILKEGRTHLTRRLYNKLPSALKLFTSTNDILKLLDDLNFLMVKLSEEVADDLSKNPNLERRLPARYIKAFREIR